MSYLFSHLRNRRGDTKMRSGPASLFLPRDPCSPGLLSELNGLSSEIATPAALP